jgi:hypothetical protein
MRTKLIKSKSVTAFIIIVICLFTSILSGQVTNDNIKYGIDRKTIKPYAKFFELPITCIQPEGWLKNYLETQRDGLTGHLEVAGYPFNKIWWGTDKPGTNTSIQKWWVYEQNGYWVDGMIRCGYLLQDTFLINKAQKQIQFVIDHPDSTGFLGPEFMKPSHEGDRWTYAVFFRSLLADYSATGNNEILNALKNHYFSDHFPHSSGREVVNTETMLSVYEYSGDTAMLNWAEKVYHIFLKSNDDYEGNPSFYMKDEPGSTHGVTYNELAKLGAIFYMFTGKQEYLEPSVYAYQRLDKYNMMIDGVNVSSEKLRSPVTSLQAHETCDIADYTWSLGYLLMATGNVEYADKIERAIFNAAPGAVRSDFKALQYFSSTNQVIAAKNSDHSPADIGGPGMSYRPNPLTECCPGNLNRIMPNFTARLWMDDGDYGLVAAMFAPSAVTYKVGKDRRDVKIDEITNYPFEGKIEFQFATKSTVEFPFTFRIPEWCSNPKILFNGKNLNQKFESGKYCTIRRKFSDKDKLTLIFPQKLKVVTSADHGISVERGPLVYALKINEDWQIDKEDKKSTPEFPAYNLYAKSDWNYALCLNSEPLESQIKIIRKPMNNNPWSIENAPIELKVPAKKVNGWQIINSGEVERENWITIKNAKGFIVDWKMTGIDTVKGNFQYTPPLPLPEKLLGMLSKNVEDVTLIPYGCSKLRITIFPEGD